MDVNPQDRVALEALEEELWREESRFDRDRMEELLADDFVEFGASGRAYGRADTLGVPREPIGAALPLPNFKARMLGIDTAQVTYDSAMTSEGTVRYARRSSIWSREGGRWRLRFHQGTPFEPSR